MDLTSTALGRFFVDNFALLLVSVVTVIIAIQHFKQHRQISIYTILLISSALLLEVFSDVEAYAKQTYVTGQEGLYYLALSCAIICYILRPACICFMILMTNHFVHKKYLWTIFIPFAVNTIIFLCAFIPGSSQIIFGFAKGDDGLGFIGGPLRYSAHVVSALYLAFLLILVIINSKNNHIVQSIVLFICLAFVVAAVIIESFFNDGSTIQILNTTIAVSTLVYYLYLYLERTQTDGLTGLFNRESFYVDEAKMDSRVVGVIQFDMNGLKYINDNFGHSEGDKALKTIAEAINASISSNMCAYRLGGDEFVVLVTGGDEDAIKETIAKFKEEINKTNYHCSVGSSYRQGRDIPLKALIKESEEEMYKDKEEFYKSAKFERRKAE